MHKFDVIGNNQIEINYDGTTIGFIINKEIHTILVSGPHQDAQNYFHIIQKSNKNDFDELANIQYELDDFSLTQLEVFLKRIETGSYYVFQLMEPMNFVEQKENQASQLYFSMESSSLIVSTNSLNNIDQEKTNEHKENILKGEFPIVFLYSKTYSDAELDQVFFVISGNEALKAYQELGMKPRFIAIVNHTENDYDHSNEEILRIISSHKEIKDTSYQYFY